MIDPTPTRADLARLRDKYERMLKLRHDHMADTEPPDVRAHLKRLAEEFPGALREIDELPVEELRRRIDALAEAERDAGSIAPWMTATHLYHALTRGALCAKKWLAGRKIVGASERAAFESEAGALCYAEDARAWAEDLSHIAAPPRGRLTELVFARMAQAMGVSEGQARRLVFGLSRKLRDTAT
jgi:hypothetical protein